MNDEQYALALDPIVSDSIQHNARTLNQIRSLTSSLFGITAGTLSLTALWGFAFYFAGHVLVSLLVWGLLIPPPARAAVGAGIGEGGRDVPGGRGAGAGAGEGKGKGGTRGGGEGRAKRYFYRPWADLWSSDLLGGLSGFVLTWTVAFNLCGA